jgi:hypothetical protein
MSFHHSLMFTLSLLLLSHHASSLSSPALKDARALQLQTKAASVVRRSPALVELNAQGNVDLQHSPPVSSSSTIRASRPSSPAQSRKDSALVDERQGDWAALEAAAREEDHPLPPWAQVLIGIVTMLVVAGTVSHIKAICTAPVPRSADSERLAVVLAETMDKVEILEKQLEERYAIVDAAAQFDDDPETAAAKQQERETQEQQIARAKEYHAAAEKVVEQKEQILAQAAALHSSFKEAVVVSRERVEDFGREEAKQIYAEMNKAVGEREIPQWAPPSWMAVTEDESAISIPPVTQLVAGAFAPSRIRWVRYTSGWTQLLCTILATSAVIVFLVDRKRPCRDQMVWIWLYGLFTLCMISFFCGGTIIYWCTVELNHLHDKREEEEKNAAAAMTGIGLFDMIANLRRGSLGFFEAYFRLHSVIDSWLYEFMQIVFFVDLCWNGFGLYITIADVLVDELACDAKSVLTFLHVNSCMYVVFMSWSLIVVLLSITNSLGSSSQASIAIIKAAKAADKSLFKNLPVVLSFVQSYILKNSSEALGLTERQVRDELRNLYERERELEEKLRLRKRVCDRIHREEALGGSSEAEFMERSERRLQTILEQAKPLVGLLAANVSNEPVDQSKNDFHGYASKVGDQRTTALGSDRASPYSGAAQIAHESIEEEVEGQGARDSNEDDVEGF